MYEIRTKRIDQLNELLEISDDDLLLIQADGMERKVTSETLKSYFGSSSDDDRISELENRLDDLIADINYKPIKITSFVITNSNSVREIGSVVTGVNLTWSIDKTPKTLTLNGKNIDVLSRSFDTPPDLSFTTNTTWILKATDERDATSTASVGISFANGIYYGMAEDPGVIDQTFIKGLGNKILNANKNLTVKAAGGESQYFWYAYPARLKPSLFHIGIGDYEYNCETVSFTNDTERPVTEDYYVYRSVQYLEEAVSITVIDA